MAGGPRFLFAVIATVSLAAVAHGDNREATRVLRAKGLTRVGNLWRNSEDVEFRKRLSGLDRAMTGVKDARQIVTEMIQKNESRRNAIQQTETELAQLRQQKSLAETDRKKRITELESRLNELRELYLQPSDFCSHPTVRSAVIALNSAQSRLAHDCLTMHQRVASVNAAYEQAKNDSQVQNALAQLGSQHQLGKAKLSAADQRRLTRGEKIATSDDIPMYSRAGQFRVAATIGLATPLTITFQPGNGPGYLPHSLIRKAGITIPDSAPKQQFEVEEGRILPVRVIHIDYLRLGSRVIEDVIFYALPPEGEDLGSRFTSETLEPYKAKEDPAHLRLILHTGMTS